MTDEARIEQLKEQIKCFVDSEKTLAAQIALKEFEKLVASRSPELVAKMEKEKGLV